MMPMEWVIDAHNQLNKIVQKRATIERGAESIWKNLCNSVELSVNTYRGLQYALPVESSGPQNHDIWIAVFDHSPDHSDKHERDRVTIEFDRNELKIIASFASQTDSAVFGLDLDDKDRPCLKSGARTVGSDKAAEMILRPILFPDLASKPSV